MQDRKLPPEADMIMRDYMNADPTAAIPEYFQQVACKASYAEHFGPNSERLENLINTAGANGTRGEDMASARYIVNAITGHMPTSIHPAVQRGINALHAVGTLSLMGRSVWSSISEPMNLFARTGNMKATLHAFAYNAMDLAKKGTA